MSDKEKTMGTTNWRERIWGNTAHTLRSTRKTFRKIGNNKDSELEQH